MLKLFENLFMMIIIMSSLSVLIVSNPVQSLLWLMLTFAFSSLIFMIFGVELMSMMIFMVYMGAMAVLFLFVIMMLNVKMIELSIFYLRYLSIGFIIISFFLMEIFLSLIFELNLNIYNKYFFINWMNLLNFKGNLFLLGSLMFNYYFFIFLLLSLVLFMAMISSIVLLVDWDLKFHSNVLFNNTFFLIRKYLIFLK